MKSLAAALLLGAAATAAPPMNPLHTIDALPDLTQALESRYPTRRCGLLWWRGDCVAVARAEELQAARAGKEPLWPDVVAFLNHLAPATGAQGAR